MKSLLVLAAVVVASASFQMDKFHAKQIHNEQHAHLVLLSTSKTGECAQCGTFKKVWERYESEHEFHFKYFVADVHSEDGQFFAAENNISIDGMPSVLLYKGGQHTTIMTASDVFDYDQLKRAIQEATAGLESDSSGTWLKADREL
eukprot:TRINITY_DN5343_c0_g1_i1.p1 TRINITY_DN5343_c0_g1~~TRINITY_DN5343_c0_g1_i1.p1  ORF type:complete len:146 (+),score=19.75 TRINITY_DN5343_c0_g1_i1:45-482(+)